MPSARKILAKSALAIGIALGAAAGGFWFYLMWEAAAAETHSRTAMNTFWAGVWGGAILLGLILWPFAWFADRIDPPPRPDERSRIEALTAAPRIRLPRSKPSKRTRR